MTKRDARYTSLHARVTPEMERDLIEYHTRRVQAGARPRHFTASLRDVLAAGLRALQADRSSHTVTTHTDERAA